MCRTLPGCKVTSFYKNTKQNGRKKHECTSFCQYFMKENCFPWSPQGTSLLEHYKYIYPNFNFVLINVNPFECYLFLIHIFVDFVFIESYFDYVI